MKQYAVRSRTPAQWAVAIIAIVAVLIVGAVLINNPPQSVSAEAKSNISSSKNDGHITGSEYDQIKNGKTYSQVKKIIGSDGKNIFESGDKGTDSYQISYMWTGENGGEATISFSGKSELTVLMKSQSGLK